MYVDDVLWEVKDKGYKGYLTVPNRVGGACLSQIVVDWFYRWMVEHKCKSYLEIGVFDGILISLLAEKYPDTKCYAIDPFQKAENTGGGHWEYFYVNCKDYENVYLYKDKSENVLPKLLEKGLVFDLIFIDGDHSYEACKVDLDLSYKLLAPGGVMVLHDANMPGVIRAIQEFEDLNERKHFSDWSGMPLFQKEK